MKQSVIINITENTINKKTVEILTSSYNTDKETINISLQTTDLVKNKIEIK